MWGLSQAGEQDPDIFFTDRPRESRQAQRNREYITFFADEAPRVLAGRSPIECYTDFMRAFRSAFFDDIGNAIEEIVIGCGPCGELRQGSIDGTALVICHCFLQHTACLGPGKENSKCINPHK